VPLLIVLLTVPGLYYLSDGGTKTVSVFVHTYLGLGLLLPGLMHPFFNKSSTER
jgi:hypothetical protein